MYHGSEVEIVRTVTSLIHGKNLERRHTLLVPGSKRKLRDTDDQEMSESDKYNEIMAGSVMYGNPKW